MLETRKTEGQMMVVVNRRCWTATIEGARELTVHISSLMAVVEEGAKGFVSHVDHELRNARHIYDVESSSLVSSCCLDCGSLKQLLTATMLAVDVCSGLDGIPWVVLVELMPMLRSGLWVNV